MTHEKKRKQKLRHLLASLEMILDSMTPKEKRRQKLGFGVL